MSAVVPPLDRGHPSLSPLHIEIILWAQCRVGPMDNQDAPAVVEYSNALEQEGILKRPGSHGRWYDLTDKGEAYLAAMLSLPFPVQRWEVPR